METCTTLFLAKCPTKSVNKLSRHILTSRCFRSDISWFYVTAFLKVSDSPLIEREKFSLSELLCSTSERETKPIKIREYGFLAENVQTAKRIVRKKSPNNLKHNQKGIIPFGILTKGGNSNDKNFKMVVSSSCFIPSS